MLCLATSQGLAQRGPSPVADAVKRQDPIAVQTLLDDGADVNAPQGDGATALHWAAYWDELTTARLLMAAGATVATTNALGVTPLWLACNNGSAAMVGALLDAGADANAYGYTGAADTNTCTNSIGVG